MIIQNEPVGEDQRADLSFTVERSDLDLAEETIRGLGDVSADVLKDERIGKVSIVGAGMRSHPGVAAKVFETLGESQINIEMISTSPIKISCVIDADAGAGGGEGPARGVRARRRRGPRGGPDRQRAPPDRARHERQRLQSRGARRNGCGRARRSSRCSPSADFPAREVVPLASERSAGKRDQLQRLRARVSARSARRRSRASTSSSPRPAARSAPSGRRSWSTPARSSSTTPATGACTMTCRWSSPRSTPTRSRPTRESSPTRTARRCRWSSRWRRSTARSGSSG